MSCNLDTFGLSVFQASIDHIDKAFQDLSRDMDPRFVHVFLDKLQRYAIKPDRALFLAQQQGHIIGFATIIDNSPAPREFAELAILQNYACGTGLMVLVEYRHNGVASCFVREWENWAMERGFEGVWVVTRKMADWYRVHFDYSLLGDIVRNNTKKTLLVKGL